MITKTEAYISGQGVDAASPHLLLYSSSLSCSSLSVFYGRVPIRTHSTYHVCQGYCRGGWQFNKIETWKDLVSLSRKLLPTTILQFSPNRGAVISEGPNNSSRITSRKLRPLLSSVFFLVCPCHNFSLYSGWINVTTAKIYKIICLRRLGRVQFQMFLLVRVLWFRWYRDFNFRKYSSATYRR